MGIKNYLVKVVSLATGGSVMWVSKVFAQIEPPLVPDTPTRIEDVIANIINVLLFVVGVTAVIMLIVGGIRYITSGGSQENVTKAKNTIIYAIVGIVVAVVAYALVNFVVTRLTAN